MAKCVSSVYKFLILISQVSYGLYLLQSPPIRPVFAGLKTIGIHNLWLLTILYLLVITFFSFALTYVDNLIFSARQKS